MARTANAAGRRKRGGLTREVVALLAVLLAAVAFSWHAWSGPRWGPDSLFYEAQRLEVGGVSAQQARDRVFFTDPRYLAARNAAFLVRTDPAYAAKLLNHRWIDYSSRFYRRRWLVPVAAEAIAPQFGLRSLMIVSYAGYLACGLLLYAFLRIRFSSILSAGVAISALVLASLRAQSAIGDTDSWGLALMIMALITADRTLRSSRRWLAAFVPIMALLSFTRDDGIVVIVAAAILALVYKRREAWALVAAGVAATIPALVAFGVPVREEIAYTFNGFQPTHAGWAFIARRYPMALVHEQRMNARFVVLQHPYTGIFFVLGLLVLAFRFRTSVGYTQLACAAGLGGIAFLLINPNPNGTHFRLELVLLPAAACGIAYIVRDAAALVRRRWRSAPSLRAPSRGSP